ncbi:NAD(P)H-dependent oxidoreductase [Streptomyces somaliensis]|uniref:flavodoxin family protein n=1 Tax=Streptomyces somaliensis TaxID=78355 RepID=UPI0020CCD848|nr:NAD(P)H-dependent oxidoreductase [Streptomyces somaliensis]MCP9946863.1 NAD(P)H-dependent oxidoreductase [Streptomyces somaliensis]MCP9963502.1 NAD(P)H-dependent oxidoreductase [Streptomyces somaliensis]
MKIVALSCTQKRLPSVTDALLEAAITGVLQEVDDAEIQRIRLIDYRITMCEGEDTCLDPEVGRCTLDDDFERVVDLAEGAQGMLLAMPVYAGNVPAVLKIFQERLKSFMNAKNRPFGNLLVGTIVHSRTMLTEPALGSLFPWYLRLRNKNVASACVSQNDHQDLARTAAPDLCAAVGRQLGMTLDGSRSPAHNRAELPLVQSPPRPRCGDPAASLPGA